MHVCEPSLDRLKEIQKQLAESTQDDDTRRKFKAVTLQIERREQQLSDERV